MNKPIRILLVDDHFTVRLGLATSLDLEDDFEVAAQAGSGSEAFQLYRKHRPDVVIMDWRLPDANGPDVIRRLKAENANACVLILSAFEGEENVYQAIDAGANGYVLKTADAEELFGAIRDVSEGRKHLPAKLAARLEQRRSRPSLTAREMEVLERMVAGRSNKEIAHELSLAEITVKQHVSSLLKKLDVQDRTQAALAAVQRGIVIAD